MPDYEIAEKQPTDGYNAGPTRGLGGRLSGKERKDTGRLRPSEESPLRETEMRLTCLERNLLGRPPGHCRRALVHPVSLTHNHER